MIPRRRAVGAALLLLLAPGASRAEEPAPLPALRLSLGGAADAESADRSEADGPRICSDPEDILGPRLFLDTWRDQTGIWTSPLRVRPRDLLWIAPLVAAEAVLIRNDRGIAGEMNERGRASAYYDVSEDLSEWGSGYATLGTSGALFAAGRAFGDERMARAGAIAFRAQVDVALVAQTIKLATRRARPGNPNAGLFGVGGSSFPSGHSAAIWSLAAVLHEEYADVPLVRWGSIAGAAAVSASRFSGRNHFASDILAGSALGWLVGRYVVRKYDPVFENGLVVSPALVGEDEAPGVSVSVPF